MRRGHEVTIVASSFYHKARRETRKFEGKPWFVESVEGVTFCWVRTPSYSGSAIARFWNMFVFMRRIWFQLDPDEIGQPDVIIGSSPPLFGAYGAMRLAARLRVPFLVEIRDLWPDSLVDLDVVSRWHPIVAVFRFVEVRLYRNARKVITLLPSSVPYFGRFGTEPKDVVWIPNCYSRITGGQTPEPVSRRDSNQEFMIVYAGVHGFYSCLDMLIDAMRLVEQSTSRSIHLRMIGEGPKKADLMAQAQSAGLKSVTFEDAVPKEELAGKLADADAFVLVKRTAEIYRWGFSPNKLFDYFAQGRPVIFAGDMAHDYVTMADAGVSVGPSSEELAQAIVFLAETDVKRRDVMGRNARRYAEQNHDMDVLAGRLVDALQDVRHTSARAK